MANASNFLRNALYNHIFRNTPYTPPANVYVALYSTNPTAADTGTEISGAGYARQVVTLGAPTNGSGSNAAQVNLPVATANYPATVTHFGLRTAATGGNLLAYQALTTPRTITQGEAPIISVGQLIANLL